MGDVLKYSTLASWITSLNTVRSKLSLTSYSDSSTSAATVAKASAVNNYLASINALRSNTYGSYGVYAISNPETINTDDIIDDDIVTKIESTLSDLNNICANTLSDLTSTSGFSIQGTTLTGFSRTSFTRTFAPSHTNCAFNSANNSNFTDFSPDSLVSGFSNFSDGSDAYYGDFNRNTSNGTDSPFNSYFNTANSDCNLCVNFECSEFSNCATFSNFNDECSNFSNCTTNVNFSNFNNNTNYSPNQTCSNTCSNTGTVNTLTAKYSGFAVRT